MTKDENSIGKILMQAALAVLLFVGGLSIFTGNHGGILNSITGGFNDLGARTIQSFFSGNPEQIVLYIFAAVELVAGVLLILNFFAKSINQVADIFLLIVVIVFIVGIILVDIAKANWGNANVWNLLYSLAKDVLVLSTMIVVKARV